MNKKIKEYVIKCDVFQINKSENIMLLGLLYPLHIMNHNWEEIYTDVIEVLLMSNGKDKIFILVEKLTKHEHFMDVKKTYSAK